MDCLIQQKSGSFSNKNCAWSRLYSYDSSYSTAGAIPASVVTDNSTRDVKAPQNDKAFSNVRILIAEDNLVNQKVALGQLHNLGYRAETVSNGRVLLEALENHHVDIILMDCQMPEMDGFAATAEIRRREGAARHTTIIAMTANALDGDAEKCLAAGMDDYLSKPVKSDALRLKLEQWIKPSESEKGLSEADEPAPTTRRSVINQAQLASLRLAQQPEEADFVTELIDLFLIAATSDLKTLREAQKRDNPVEMQQVAHRLRGSSGNIGATYMAELSEDLERKDSIQDSKSILAALENEFELVREALNAERKETAPSLCET